MLSLTSLRRLTLAIAAGLIALLVLLPVSVASIKAAIAQQSNNTNSEETEDHSKEESRAVRHERLRPPPKSPPPRIAPVVIAHHAPAFTRSVALPPHPAQLSVRRLL